MSETDYLTILVAQTLGMAQSIQPLIPPMFSLAQFPPPTVEVDVLRPLLNDEFFQAKPIISRRGEMHHTLSVSRVIPVGQHEVNSTFPHALDTNNGQSVINHAPTEPNQIADLDWKISLSHSRVPGASMPTSEHDEPTYRRDGATSMLNDTSQVPGYSAANISSKNKTNPLQSSSPISRDISQSSSSHRPISHPLHVPQDSISVEPSLLETNERPQGFTSPDMAWANGQPHGSTPPPTPPSPLLYNEKDVREAHHSVYSRGGGGRVEWGGPLWSPVELQQATDPKNLPLRSPVEAPIVPEPILHTKTNPSNFVGIDSPRPQADVSRSPVGADSSRSYQRPFSSNEQPLEPVRVTIGRVEVRATLAAQEPSQRTQATRPAQPAISLQTYLEQRRSGKV